MNSSEICKQDSLLRSHCEILELDQLLVANFAVTNVEITIKIKSFASGLNS